MSSDAVLCPRCQQESFTPYGKEWHMGDPFPPALSRISRGYDDAPIYVCSRCGQDEAMREFSGQGAQPPSEWPVAISFAFPVPNERGGLE